MPDADRHDHPPAGRTRLGTVVRRGKWPVLLLWIVAAMVATPLAERLGDVERDDAAAFLPRGFDSTQVARLVEGDPNRPDTRTAMVIYHRDGAELSAADLATITEHRQLARSSGAPAAGAPSQVEVSADGQAALFTVEIRPTGREGATAEVVQRLRTSTHTTASAAGLQVQVAGDAGLAVDTDAGDVDAALLLTSMAIVAVLLLLTYRSPLLWLVPLVVAVLAVQVARGAAYGLAEAGLPVTELSTAILVVLVFGVATDYALLLLNRYREELARHPDRHEAIAVAVRRTAPALVASAATVTAGLLCLLFARLAGLSGLGPVAAAGVVVAVAAMLTGLPAILACGGRWLLWPRAPRPGEPRGTGHRIWARLAAVVARRPRVAAAAVTVALAAAVLGLTGLHTSADPLDKVPPGSESVAGQRALSEHFPPGRSAPLTVVLPAGTDPGQAAAARQAVATAPQVAAVTGTDPVQGRPALTVQLAVDPYGDVAADAVRQLRTRLAAVDEGILVGGSPAVQLDYHAAALRDTRTVLPLVLLVVALILGLLLRSVVAPVMLIGTVVLSFAAALGLSSLAFTRLLGTGGVAADLVIYVFVFLVALGVDYNIFLMERVRELRRRMGTAAAVRHGLTATGGVITAAGLVLAGTFATLGQLPDVTVAQVGIAVAIGVLVDTMIVRTVQVPALVILLGERTWWPSRPPWPASGRAGGATAGAGWSGRRWPRRAGPG